MNGRQGAAVDFQTVTTLADLKNAGAVGGMELDIDPEWPPRSRTGTTTDSCPATSSRTTNHRPPALVPADGDFFAVYGRLPGPIAVPLKW